MNSDEKPKSVSLALVCPHCGSPLEIAHQHQYAENNCECTLGFECTNIRTCGAEWDKDGNQTLEPGWYAKYRPTHS